MDREKKYCEVVTFCKNAAKDESIFRFITILTQDCSIILKTVASTNTRDNGIGDKNELDVLDIYNTLGYRNERSEQRARFDLGFIFHLISIVENTYPGAFGKWIQNSPKQSNRMLMYAIDTLKYFDNRSQKILFAHDSITALPPERQPIKRVKLDLKEKEDKKEKKKKSLALRLETSRRSSEIIQSLISSLRLTSIFLDQDALRPSTLELMLRPLVYRSMQKIIAVGLNIGKREKKKSYGVGPTQEQTLVSHILVEYEKVFVAQRAQTVEEKDRSCEYDLDLDRFLVWGFDWTQLWTEGKPVGVAADYLLDRLLVDLTHAQGNRLMIFMDQRLLLDLILHLFTKFNTLDNSQLLSFQEWRRKVMDIPSIWCQKVAKCIERPECNGLIELLLTLLRMQLDDSRRLATILLSSADHPSCVCSQFSTDDTWCRQVHQLFLSLRHQLSQTDYGMNHWRFDYFHQLFVLYALRRVLAFEKASIQCPKRCEGIQRFVFSRFIHSWILENEEQCKGHQQSSKKGAEQWMSKLTTMIPLLLSSQITLSPCTCAI